jgi:hypothetical protein
MVKYFLSFCFFITFFKVFQWMFLKNDFDTSGHMVCSILVYSNYVNICNYFSLFKDEMRDQYALSLSFFITNILILHQSCCLFFTAFIYHDIYETGSGVLFGLFIQWLIFYDDFLSNAFYSILIGLFPKQFYTDVYDNQI